MDEQTPSVNPLDGHLVGIAEQTARAIATGIETANGLPTGTLQLAASWISLHANRWFGGVK